jgi:hypothetical protein
VVPDVEHDGYCFSDGVGRISPELLSEVLLEMELPPDAPKVSAVQVRWRLL